MQTAPWLLTSALLAALASATPTATPAPDAFAAYQPVITPAADLQRRQALSSLTSAVGSVASNAGSAVTGDISSILTAVGSGLPSYVASGVLPLEGLPTAGAVQSSLNLSDDAVKALPTQG